MNLKINLPKLFWSYSLCLFPLFILVGPLIAEFYVFAIIVFTHIYIINEKKFYFLNNKYIIFFILFYISTIFSTLLNFYNFNYSKSAIFFFRFIFFSIAIWYVLKTYNVFSKKTVFLYSLLLLTIIIDALIQYYSGKNILGYEILRNRISSFFGDELVLGSFITRFIPIFLVYLLMTDNITENKINIFYSLIISFSSVIVYLSGERTSFFLLILFFLTLFILSKYLRKLIVFIIISSIVLSLIITKLQTNEQLNVSDRMFQKTYQQIIGDGKNTIESKKKLFNKIYIFSHDHHGHYLLSYKIFKDYPVFGTGVKGFRYLCRSKIYILENNEGCSTHPHNTYIQILVSNGIVGFFLIIFAFFYILREIFLCKKKLNSQIIFDKNELSKGVILLLIFINLWPLVPTGNFFNNWISIIYFYPIGFYLYFKHLNEKKIN